jgi:hypothetical protein
VRWAAISRSRSGGRREQRALDRLAAHPRVSVREQGAHRIAGRDSRWIRDIKQRGADGLKIIGMDRDQLEAIMDEAHKLGLRTATHIAVEETTPRITSSWA